MQKQFVPLVLVALVLLVGSYWYYQSKPAVGPTVSTYPILLPADQVLVEDTNASSSAPLGFHMLRDTELKVTFNAPLDWKAQVLPEGDGRPSIISPDYFHSATSTAGAYLHYYSTSLPDAFIGKPVQYMTLLKQGRTWTETTFDGHAAFISKGSNGYTSVISQFGDNWFVGIDFSDPGKKYTSVLNEFLRSFHTL